MNGESKNKSITKKRDKQRKIKKKINKQEKQKKTMSRKEKNQRQTQNIKNAAPANTSQSYDDTRMDKFISPHTPPYPPWAPLGGPGGPGGWGLGLSWAYLGPHLHRAAGAPFPPARSAGIAIVLRVRVY